MDVHRPCCELDLFTIAGQIIGALAVDLNGRELRRDLLDDAGKDRQQRLYRLPRRPRLARPDNTTLGVVGVPLLAPLDGEAVGLAAVHHEGNSLRGLAHRDW